MLDAIKQTKALALLQTWMTSVLIPYYQSRNEREQLILRYAAVLLPILLFISLILQPMYEAKQSRLQALVKLQKQVVEAESYADMLQQKGPISHSQNNMAMVDREAKKFAVQKFITRMKPQPGGDKGQRLLIQLRSAPYEKVLRFLSALSKQGLSFLSVNMQKDKKPGVVHVQMVVE